MTRTPSRPPAPDLPEPEEAAAHQEPVESPVTELEETVGRTLDRTVGRVVERAAPRISRETRPKLRGWLHLAAAPVAAVSGIVLVAVSRGAAEITASAVYAVTTTLLFTVSATYHRGNWSPRAHQWLMRFDHANIFLIIAGSYTPFTVVLLRDGRRLSLLILVWAAALAGVTFRLLWIGAPRWLYVPAYIALGWVALFFLPDFASTGGVAVLVLIMVGGLLYTAGGVVYALRRPDPYPAWFGFHEVFHALTLAAYVVQFIAVMIAVLTH
jgi:hemolysin III